MARVTLPNRIKSVSGKIGNIIFYTRKGKQFARRIRTSVGPISDELRSILESLSALNT